MEGIIFLVLTAVADETEIIMSTQFQSTLHGGGRPGKERERKLEWIFQPTPSACRRLSGEHYIRPKIEFQPTPSAWRATARCCDSAS